MKIYRQPSNDAINFKVSRSDVQLDYGVPVLEDYAKDANNSNWYADAHLWAKDVATKLYYPLETVVAVTALISPLTEWNLNKRRAIRVLEAWNHGEKISVHTKATMQQVYNCLEHKEFNFGPKTGAFYDCILNPHTSNDVVIDSLAVAIVLGLGDVPGAYNMKENTLLAAKDIYRAVAKKYNVKPNRLQAATWEKANNNRKGNRGLGAAIYNRFTTVTDGSHITLDEFLQLI
jgi:hypothetical protein